MVIGVSGSARSGKDSFFLLLKSQLQNTGIKCVRTAFADKLKSDINPLLIKNLNINLNNCSDEVKSQVRPLMVSYGELARSLDEDHWIKKVKDKISKEQEGDKVISVITDVRYPNEQKFIKRNFKDYCNVYIERFGTNPANSEEEKNTPSLKKQSDYLIYWKNFSTSIEEGIPMIDGFINERVKI